MNPFQKFVAESARIFRSGTKLPAGQSPIRPHPKLRAAAPKALIFSPHPDDECIIGGLALRLAREAEWNVINVAVTLGSKRARQAARRVELQRACAGLGFGLVVPGGKGLARINPETRRRDRSQWATAVTAIAQILAERQPRAIFVPHENDGHATHIGTHLLVLDALKTLPKTFQCHVAETEFWGQMAKPNLLVESSVGDVAELVAALAFHVGEVRRNPYHARLPAWLLDNVRRAERVAGPGVAAPDFTFGTIYRLGEWRGGKRVFKRGKLLSARENPAGLFDA